MAQQPLLMNDLTDIQRASLASLVQQPGWAVVELMHMDACKRATEAVIKLDPEEADHRRKLELRQLKARERNEFSGLILNSVQYHIDAVTEKQREDGEKPTNNPIVGKGMNNDN
jgi:hypothetical protein